jgi:hypothetical protein
MPAMDTEAIIKSAGDAAYFAALDAADRLSGGDPHYRPHRGLSAVKFADQVRDAVRSDLTASLPQTG